MQPVPFAFLFMSRRPCFTDEESGDQGFRGMHAPRILPFTCHARGVTFLTQRWPDPSSKDGSGTTHGSVDGGTCGVCLPGCLSRCSLRVLIMVPKRFYTRAQNYLLVRNSKHLKKTWKDTQCTCALCRYRRKTRCTFIYGCRCGYT